VENQKHPSSNNSLKETGPSWQKIYQKAFLADTLGGTPPTMTLFNPHELLTLTKKQAIESNQTNQL
jgi:hypothetical protein